MLDTVELAMALIGHRSVTPEDAGCQTMIAAILDRLGFVTEHLRFGEVDNLWAVRGSARPLFVFAGHTDVVPPGPLGTWTSDPFVPAVRGELLFGRGAADMKGSIAAMLAATELFIASHPLQHGSLGFLLTSDEEGPAIDGTVKVIDTLNRRDQRIDYCLVGEPSSDRRLGDVLRIGRRGSLSAVLHVAGVQGHVAYPDKAINPIHQLSPALAELCAIEWDQGNQHYPPTSFQVSNIRAGTGAENVIPGELDLCCNFRYGTEVSVEQLQRRVEDLLRRHGLNYRIEWALRGEPFITQTGVLIDAARAAVRELTGIDPVLSTGGGTSDGRFIAPTGAEVVELGPCNTTIHQANECVRIAELRSLSAIYEAILRRLLAGEKPANTTMGASG